MTRMALVVLTIVLGTNSGVRAQGTQPGVPKTGKPTSKPTVIKAEELARLGDYKGAFRTDSPEFAAFGKKYDGQLVKVTGRVANFYPGLAPTGFRLSVTWRDPHKPTDLAVGVRVPVEVPRDGVHDRELARLRASAELLKKGLPVGSVVGKLVYDADAHTITIEEAIYQLGWPR